MSLQETIHCMKDLLNNILHDLEKSHGGNKAASQRVRTGTVSLEKVAKQYRKESLHSEHASQGLSKKAAAKKAVAKKPMVKKPVAKAPIAKAPIAKAPVVKKPVAKKPVAKKPVAAPKKATVIKAKSQTKAHQTKARFLSFKKPSAKLLSKA
jgi:hypothetical protein